MNFAMRLQSISLVCLAGTMISCAALHHYQMGEIDNRDKFVAIPFDIKVSEVGVSLGQVKAFDKAMSGGKASDGGKAAEILGYFQMGPSTGAPVYEEKYARNLVYKIYEVCPSGRVTGLRSIREAREYPVISGEIVKVTGFCLKDKSTAVVQ